jgi:hypothetical protein
LLVDPSRNPRQILKPGEAKALDVDKVIVVPGPPEELAVIRRIFERYVQHHQTFREIARHLSEEGVKGYGEKPLSIGTIRNIVSNELCIGQMTYNMTTVELQGRPFKNPDALWTRFPAFEPVVSVEQFRKAQELRSRCAKGYWSDEKIIKSLQRLLTEKGRISQILINGLKGGPSADTVVNHFGSLTAARSLMQRTASSQSVSSMAVPTCHPVVTFAHISVRWLRRRDGRDCRWRIIANISVVHGGPKSVRL